jgi:hypothetical protein
MTGPRVLAAVLASMAIGCASERSMGNFTLVASRSLEGFEVPDGQKRVEGRACFGSVLEDDDAYQRAVEDALRKAPGANVLVLVEMQDVGECVEVKGWPIVRPVAARP